METRCGGIACAAVARRTVLLFLIGGTAAHACQIVKRDDDIAEGRVMLTQEAQPGVQLHVMGNGRNGLIFERCANLVNLDVEVTWNAPGLRYVRDVPIGGKMFPAFGWHASSPLVALMAYKISSGAAPGTDRTALRPGQLNRFTVQTGAGSNTAMSYALTMWVVSRGGEMTGTAPQAFSATTRFPGLSGSPVFTHQQTFELAFPQRTCTLADRTLTLDPVAPSVLMQTGDTAGMKPLEVMMRCPAGGISVLLTLTDALDSGNRTSALRPTPGSDAEGVAIELLRRGQPVGLGAQWSHGPSIAGDQVIALSARYLRLASPLKAGSTGGQAILTADYR